MNKNMETLCNTVSEVASLYGRPTDDQTDEAIVRAVLEKLKTLSDESGNFNNIINTLINED